MPNGFDAEWLDRLQAGRKSAQSATGATNAPIPSKRAKYGNKTVLVAFGAAGEVVGGKLRLVHTFDSQREADYYQTLKLRRAAGEIDGLELQKPYALIAHAQVGPSVIIGYYEADFVFCELQPSRRVRVIDVKGMKTQMYALKKKLVEACWGIVVEEV